MKALYTPILLFFLLSINTNSQDDPIGLPVYDSYESLKEAYPEHLERTPLESEFFKGSALIQFQDGSTITPEGVMIKISRVFTGDKAKPVNKAITDVKGMFYLRGMTTGDYMVEVAFKGNQVLKKYFTIPGPGTFMLAPLVIPVENIEREEIQRQQYQKF
jgi:hypothetical protein